MRLLVLGAGYLGAKAAELALDRGDEVMLADNWWATDRGQLAPLELRGARVVTVDIRDRAALDALMTERPDRVLVLAAQATRPLAEVQPDYTEETNLSGVRRVAEAVANAGGVPVAYASSLHVYGPGLTGDVDTGHPYGAQGDLAHLSKIYAELCLDMFARRHGFALGLFRLGILYGPSPVEHARAESQTVVDKFRRLAAAGRAARGRRGRRRRSAWRTSPMPRRSCSTPRSTGRPTSPPRRSPLPTSPRSRTGARRRRRGLPLRHALRVPAQRRGVPPRVRRGVKLLVTGASGFLGSRTTQLLRERGHDVVPLVRPGGRDAERPARGRRRAWTPATPRRAS